MSSTAASAARAIGGDHHPLAGRQAVGLDHEGRPGCRGRPAAAASRTSGRPRSAGRGGRQKSLVKALEVSSRPPAARRRSRGCPASLRAASARPASTADSGRPPPGRRRSPGPGRPGRRRRWALTSRSSHTRLDAGIARRATSRPHSGDWAIFQARACSRPPEPDEEDGQLFHGIGMSRGDGAGSRRMTGAHARTHGGALPPVRTGGSGEAAERPGHARNCFWRIPFRQDPGAPRGRWTEAIGARGFNPLPKWAPGGRRGGNPVRTARAISARACGDRRSVPRGCSRRRLGKLKVRPDPSSARAGRQVASWTASPAVGRL
jgi:hypothetical protein